MDDVNRVVLESAVAILGGGVDHQGNPLIIFPTDCADLIDVYAAKDIIELLKAYVNIAGGTVAVVADLKHGWTTECIAKLTSLLDALQVVRVETFDELYNYINKDQLTGDYGGTLLYNHVAWMEFQKEYTALIKSAGKMVADIPAMKAEIGNIVKGLPQPRHSGENREENVKQICERTLEKYGVRDMIRKCQHAVAKLDRPEDEPSLEQIHSTLLLDTASKIRSLLHDLRTKTETMETDLTRTGTDEKIAAKLDECRRNTKEVIETIILMTQEITCSPRIGRNVEEAQIYRNEFIQEIFNPSRAIVDCATSILQDLPTGKNTTQSSYKASLEIARQLTESLQPFTAHINGLNETYTRIHMFYVIFDKVSRWKEKASKFIEKTLYPSIDPECLQRNFPSNLIHSGNDVIHDTRSHEEVFLRTASIASELDTHTCNIHSKTNINIEAPVGWDSKLEHFYHKHPPPKRKHLRLITKFVGDFVDKLQLIEAETLAERTMFILAFLTKKCFKSEDVVRILQWSDADCVRPRDNMADSSDLVSTI